MAFSFGSPSGPMMGSGAGAPAGASQGPDLEVIQTEGLGFLSLAGDSKVRLTSPWSPLPAPTASLVSIASRKGLVAAAGPDGITLAMTESVRKAFESPKTNGDSDVRSFQPQLKIPMPMRVSQLAFTADENHLVLSAESGGGLAVYDVQAVMQQGAARSAFELPTNGEALRALVPNPTPEKAELCAIVTEKGNLHIASLKERRISGVLKSQVSCVSWSTKGKQLVAGLADGTIHQMTPEGEGKGEIPKPPNSGNCHVSSLVWLENHVFLAIHTSTSESPPSSVYNIITRQPPSSFTFQKLSDPVDPFGAEKVPHHSILRLKNFEPSLHDLLIVSSTATIDIGLLSRSSKPLAMDKPADSITNVFTTTELLDDSKRASLPMSEEMDNTVPIGIALDLSSKDKVYKPIPADEIEESAGPVPAFWVLNHEGVLCSWWIIYTDSIRQGTTYSGMAVAEGPAQPSTPAPATIPSALTSGMGLSTFGSSTASTTPAFGGASALGAKPSPWGSSTTAVTPASTGGAVFGQSAFGSGQPSAAPAFGKPTAFGQSSMLGMRSSPWAAAGGAAAPAFGQSGFAGLGGGAASKSTFGSSTSTPSAAPASGGFASFASQGGFAALGSNNSGGSIFGSGKPASPFTTNTSDLSMDTDTAFQVQKPEGTSTASTGSVFGSQPFKLGTTFKADPPEKPDNGPAPTGLAGGSLFGSGFSLALGDAAKQPSAAPSTKDEDMDTATEAAEEPPASKSAFSLASTTPTTTPAPAKFGFITSSAPKTSIFGVPSSSGGLSGGLGGGLFKTPEPAKPKLGTATPEIKAESHEKKLSDIPLPPETTSRDDYPLGQSGSSADQSFTQSKASSKGEDAPLPPDFTATKQKTPTAVEDAPLPPDFVTPKGKTTDDAPLPPDFLKTPKAVSDAAKNTVGSVPLSGDSSKTSQRQAPAAPFPPDPTKTKPPTKTTVVSSPFQFPKPASAEPSNVPSVPDSGEESDLDESDEGSEGTGVDVEKDLKDMSPSTTGLTQTPGFTPQSSFAGMTGSTFSVSRPEQDRSRAPLFGEIGRNAPVFPQPNQPISPRSPSPVRGAVPSRVLRSESSRSVSAPGMASQILGAKKQQGRLGTPIVGFEPRNEDPFLAQQRKMRDRQDEEERQPLVDEEDEEIQKILAAPIESVLELDDFVAHANVIPAAKESIPSQVEAVYRDINSMIDTVGLNARAVVQFIKGHSEQYKEGGRQKEDLEIPDDWVLCEVDDLATILDEDLFDELEDGRVQDVEGKVEVCQELTRDMMRLRAKQDDLRKILFSKMDPEQAEVGRLLPLSTEQAAQQNELRREYAAFSKLLGEAEEALTILKAKIASATSSASNGAGGRAGSGTGVPTVDAVMRTIAKMTSMVEKRSGDVDVLEGQMRRLRLQSSSREGSPMVSTPQKGGAAGRSMFSPEPGTVGTPRNLRHSLTSSVTSLSGVRGTPPPRKKLSGFSREEKSELMERRARRQAVVDKLRSSVKKNGVNVWAMEDIE